MPTGTDLIATAVSSALGGGIVVVVLQELIRRFRLPCIQIHYGNESEYRTPTPCGSERDQCEAIYIRVKVINNNHGTTARNCRIYLTSVVRVDPEGSRFEVASQDAIRLPWSLMPLNAAYPIDIPSGVNQFSDICRTVSLPERRNDLECLCHNYPHRLREIWKKKGKFKATILVTADDIRPVCKTIEFEWDGSWDTLHAINPMPESPSHVR